MERKKKFLFFSPPSHDSLSTLVARTLRLRTAKALLNSKPFEVLVGRCRKGNNRGGQQSPQQQGGHDGNRATAHLQASVNTTLRDQCLECILTQECGRGEGKKQRASVARQSQAKARGGAPVDLAGAPTYNWRNRCIGLVLTLPRFHLASLIRRPDYQSVPLPHPPNSINQSICPPLTPPKQYHLLPDHSCSVPS